MSTQPSNPRNRVLHMRCTDRWRDQLDELMRAAGMPSRSATVEALVSRAHRFYAKNGKLPKLLE